MGVLAILVGISLGALGGALHLAVTRLRASLVVSGRGGRALLLLPAGFAAIAAAVVLAARFDPRAAWLVPVGLLAVRVALLRSGRQQT